jgi:GH15 family glucan-1,4-alpha-glucosidase
MPPRSPAAARAPTGAIVAAPTAGLPEQVGGERSNLPQAFTHLSLINAAINLDHQLDHGAGRVAVIS